MIYKKQLSTFFFSLLLFQAFAQEPVTDLQFGNGDGFNKYPIYSSELYRPHPIGKINNRLFLNVSGKGNEETLAFNPVTKDIEHFKHNLPYIFSNLITSKSKVAFGESKNIWISDGTATGTAKIPIDTGSVYVVGQLEDKFILIINLWGNKNSIIAITDGTRKGTKVLKQDIGLEYTTGWSPSRFVNYKGKVYFTIPYNKNTTIKSIVYETDGTPEGTKQMNFETYINSRFDLFNGKIYYNGINSGFSTYDLETKNTAIISSYNGPTINDHFVVRGDSLYFSVNYPDELETKKWFILSHSSSKAVELITDHKNGLISDLIFTDNGPAIITRSNSNTFYVALVDESTHLPKHLQKYQSKSVRFIGHIGNKVYLKRDIGSLESEIISLDISNLSEKILGKGPFFRLYPFRLGKKIYYNGFTSDGYRNVMVIDGQTNELKSLTEIASDKAISDPYIDSYSDNALIINAHNQQVGREPWILSESGKLELLVDNVQDSRTPFHLSYLFNFNNKLFFITTEPTGKTRLRASDAIDKGTKVIGDLGDEQTTINSIEKYAGNMYLLTNRNTLWKVDKLNKLSIVYQLPPELKANENWKFEGKVFDNGYYLQSSRAIHKYDGQNLSKILQLSGEGHEFIDIGNLTKINGTLYTHISHPLEDDKIVKITENNKYETIYQAKGNFRVLDDFYPFKGKLFFRYRGYDGNSRYSSILAIDPSQPSKLIKIAEKLEDGSSNFIKNEYNFPESKYFITLGSGEQFLFLAASLDHPSGFYVSNGTTAGTFFIATSGLYNREFSHAITSKSKFYQPRSVLGTLVFNAEAKKMNSSLPGFGAFTLADNNNYLLSWNSFYQLDTETDSTYLVHSFIDDFSANEKDDVVLYDGQYYITGASKKYGRQLFKFKSNIVSGIIKHPVSIKVLEEDESSFSISLKSGIQAKLEWQYLSNKNWTVVASNSLFQVDNMSGSSAKLVVKQTKLAADGINFRCKVTETGKEAVYSGEATLNVVKRLKINKQPISSALNSVGSAQFSLEINLSSATL